MNKVLRPHLPDESLVPALNKKGVIRRHYVDLSTVREDQKHRITDERVVKKDQKILCYWTEGGWVPEFYKTETVNQTRARVSAMIDKTIADQNQEGQFFRRGDSPYVLKALGDNGTGTFPPKRNRGHHAVPVLHDEENPAYGRYPHLGEIKGRMRVFTVLNDQNAGRLADDSNTITPIKPSTKWNPKNISTEKMPFISVPTDAMTVATTGDGNWTSQTMPHGKLSMYPWASPFHYANGFITGMVGYEGGEALGEIEVSEKDGDIMILDLEGHLQRAEDNAKRLGFTGIRKEFLRKMLEEQLKADRRWIPKQGNQPENRYYIRFAAFPNATGPVLKGPEQMIMLVGTPTGPYKATKDEQLKVALLGPRPVNSVTERVKSSGNYHGPVAKLLELMKKTGRDDLHEALFVKEDGTPQEGTSSNVFFVQAGEGDEKPTLFSPNPETAGVLPGRTVQLTMEIAKYLGWKVVGYDHEKLDMNKLIEEAKAGKVQMGMTGTAMGIRQIQELATEKDGQPESIIINGKDYSPEMKELQNIYEAILTGQHELSARFMQVVVKGDTANENASVAA